MSSTVFQSKIVKISVFKYSFQAATRTKIHECLMRLKMKCLTFLETFEWRNRNRFLRKPIKALETAKIESC